MSCRNVIAVLVAAGLLAGCDTYNAIRRDIGIDPRDPPTQQAAPQRMAQQPMTSAPPAPVMQGGIAQANWAAQRAATAAATNQGNTSPVGFSEEEKPAETAAATPAPGPAMATTPMPTRTAPSAMATQPSAQPAGAAAANRTVAAAPAAASGGLPVGYRPSPSVMDNPALAMEQQKLAAATGAVPEPPKMAGSMKEPGSVTGGSWRVHLASHRTESAAINEWQELLKANPQLYGQYDPLVSWVELQGRGSFARLELVGFPDKTAADAACAKLRAGTRYCAAVAE